ncbi:MAG: 4-hydroxy-tetrahydrodipicolinate reductase [Leptospirales bacterium]
MNDTANNPIRFAMVGAGGRMGRAIIGLVPELSGGRLVLSGALERAGSALLGVDAGELAGWRDADGAMRRAGVPLTDDPMVALADARVAIDFTSPATTLRVAEACAEGGVALLVGTTGFSEDEKKRLSAFADRIPLLVAPNMSLGVNLLFYLTGVAARGLADFETEITEIHHHHKKDAPSGTAQRLKEVVLENLALNESNVVYGRSGVGDPRPGDEVGVHALRGGDVVGEHTVFFFGDGERVELTHRATSRSTFASGALAAAKFLAGQKPGVYSMNDVLQIPGS